MPVLTTQVLVQCPRDQKQVDVKAECQDPPCMSFRHFTYRGTRMYVVCSFGEEPRKEEAVAEDPADPELEEAEEESLEVYA